MCSIFGPWSAGQEGKSGFIYILHVQRNTVVRVIRHGLAWGYSRGENRLSHAHCLITNRCTFQLIWASRLKGGGNDGIMAAAVEPINGDIFAAGYTSQKSGTCVCVYYSNALFCIENVILYYVKVSRSRRLESS